MNKIGSLLIAGLMGLCSPALAQTSTYYSGTGENLPWQFSLQGGGLWPMKENNRLQTGTQVIARLTKDVSPNVAIGAETGGLRFRDSINYTKYGHLNGIPAMGDVVFKMPIGAEKRLVPYAFASAGVIYWSYDEANVLEDAGVKAKNQTLFAAKPGVGVDYFITPRIALFVEGSYLFSERFRFKTNNTGAPPVNGKVNVNSAYGGGGIKFAF
jgi:hypothetical protein